MSVTTPLILLALLSSKSGKFQVELWRKHSSSKLYHDRQVGKCSIKFDELDEKREFLLHKQIIGTKDIGYLRFVQKEEIQRFTMVEYLRGGIKFSIAFGLDFYDRTFNTLHALDHRKRNNYETCILELTRLLLQYTADEKVLDSIYSF
jgi:hypothetical protein